MFSKCLTLEVEVKTTNSLVAPFTIKIKKKHIEKIAEILFECITKNQTRGSSRKVTSQPPRPLVWASEARESLALRVRSRNVQHNAMVVPPIVYQSGCFKCVHRIHLSK